MATIQVGTFFPVTYKSIDIDQNFSDRAEDYTIGSTIGFGASSIVYAAEFHPVSENGLTDHVSKGIPCALKVLDLDLLPVRSLQLLQRETTLMSLSKHPNVLRVRGSWMTGHKLYIALRLMNKGSAADVMRYGWPGGMEQDVVRCILAQALKGLKYVPRLIYGLLSQFLSISYLHINGFIHRDIKAANLLIDDDGTVLLGDLGVAADLAEDTSHTNTTSLVSHSELNITSSAGLTQLNSSATSTHLGNSGKSAALSTSVPIRPGMGKRKSFVGTVCISSRSNFYYGP
jgi:serine/threonine-protein kinase OSR1/STK39